MLSSSQAIALVHGASLTNIEFMQMMPGFIEPKRNLVFNEKTWRYVKFDQPVDIDDDKLKDLLEQRSGYGPFTSRLASRAIDLVIDQAGPEGLALHYDFPREDVPEFVQTFATWLQDEHGIAPSDEMRVAMYATPPTAVSKSTRQPSRASKASTPAARRQAACTAPTASAACQAPTGIGVWAHRWRIGSPYSAERT